MLVTQQNTKKKPSHSLRTLRLEEGHSLREQMVQAVKAPHRPVLIVISGNQMGSRVRVEKTLLIGRDPTADLVLTDAGVSWHHARLEDRGDTWTLIDLESTNGTTVNGRSEPELALVSNDKIIFGRTVVRFEVQDALEQAYDEVLQRLLTIDDLSGLYVRRSFDAELEKLLEAARVQHQPLGLLVMDLDGIKKINDTHGHLFGAYVIGESGKQIGCVLGNRGIGSRFGGDEFLAALPSHDSAAACALAEEIRLAIAAHPFEREGVPLRPGISIGVASYPENGENAKVLFQHGDEALYRAKQSGKNCVSK